KRGVDVVEFELMFSCDYKGERCLHTYTLKQRRFTSQMSVHMFMSLHFRKIILHRDEKALTVVGVRDLDAGKGFGTSEDGVVGE
nr:hypothetical protein [Tanacetum cinerariifolium]